MAQLCKNARELFYWNPERLVFRFRSFERRVRDVVWIFRWSKHYFTFKISKADLMENESIRNGLFANPRD